MSEKIRVGIVGSGIIGLAHALAFARQNCEVTVFERDSSPLGASIRNFGLFWPIGQEQDFLATVKRSNQIWQNIISLTNIPVNKCGSLLVAMQPDELELILEFFEQEKDQRPGLNLITRTELSSNYKYLRSGKLLGALRSGEEFVIDPRTAIPMIIGYLQSGFDINFHFNTTIREVSDGFLFSEDRPWPVDIIVICSGDEFDTLLPLMFSESGLQKCHLQMMKATPTLATELKSIICGGLSLIRYPSFSGCKTLRTLKHRLKEELPNHIEAGIHVILAQNPHGDLLIGDSHQYQPQKPLAISQKINKMIIGYLEKFAHLPEHEITELWQATYSLHPYKKHYFEQASKNIWISTGFGGAGMTLGFGQAEENVATIINQIGIHAKPFSEQLA